MIGYIKLIVLLKILFILNSCSFKNPGGFFDDSDEPEIPIFKAGL